LCSELSKVNKNHSFLLQVGNCAELFTYCNGPKIHNFLRIFLQMAMFLEFKSGKKIIKVGRIAGQYAKPRSTDEEVVNGLTIPVYRGDIVNEFVPILEKRIPNPEKLKEAYFRSAATLNLIRAFIQGGYCDISNMNDWEKHFYGKKIIGSDYYKGLSEGVDKYIVEKRKDNRTKRIDDHMYISHEALLLDYEEAFTRLDTTHGGYYDTSAHFLWIGERTRQIDGAHVEFIRGIGNPVGIKIGPNYNLTDLSALVEMVNPENIEGKLVLIVRMGKDRINERLTPLLKLLKKEKFNVTLVCDPMHGNTFTYNGYKVRSFEDITTEIKLFFDICQSEQFVPGGLHLEITEEGVTECIGGINGLTLEDINGNYRTKVDPRLNAAQALEIAFLVGDLLHNYYHKKQ